MCESGGSYYVLLGVTGDVREFDGSWLSTGNTWILTLPESYTEMTSLFWDSIASQWIVGFRDGHDAGGGIAIYDASFGYIESSYIPGLDNQGMYYDGSDTLEFYSNWNDTVFRLRRL